MIAQSRRIEDLPATDRPLPHSFTTNSRLFNRPFAWKKSFCCQKGPGDPMIRQHPNLLPTRRTLIGGFVLLICLLSVARTQANGGAIILADTIGPYNVRVTADPYPLQVGTNDISVLVGGVGDGQLILDAEVSVTAVPRDQPNQAATFPASHELASEPDYYASNTIFSEPGPWKLLVAVNGPAGPVTAEVEVQVEPGPTPAAAANNSPGSGLLYVIVGTGVILLIIAGLLARQTLSKGQQTRNSG
jgi:hypothetical protein